MLILVILAHAGMVMLMLLARPPAPRGAAMPAGSLVLLLLPAEGAESRTRYNDGRSGAALVPPNPLREPSLPPVPVDSTAITLPPNPGPPAPIDWYREAELAAQSSLAGADRQLRYRDLSALTPEQREWIKGQQLQPMPPGFAWDRSSRRELLRHGIIKLNDYCVLIIAIPFCRFGGKIQYDGDLFKHMDEPQSGVP